MSVFNCILNIFICGCLCSATHILGSCSRLPKVIYKCVFLSSHLLLLMFDILFCCFHVTFNSWHVATHYEHFGIYLLCHQFLEPCFGPLPFSHLSTSRAHSLSTPLSILPSQSVIRVTSDCTSLASIVLASYFSIPMCLSRNFASSSAMPSSRSCRCRLFIS